MKVKIKASAKVNLTLEVIKKLPNGYHELRSLIWKLDNLFDEIFLDIDPGTKGISIKSDSRDIPWDENNICFKAAQRYFEKAGKFTGLKIYIKKNIPIAAGLGGGSSDAAAVLLGLNKYFKNLFSERRLINLAASIGKDVPLFIKSKRIVVISGMGEKINSIDSASKLFFLIINPRIAVLTKEAFSLLSEKLRDSLKIRRINKTRQMKKAVTAKDIERITGSLSNDFEMIIEKKCPEVAEIKQKLLNYGARGALMSGSGSTVFGIFRSKAEVVKAEKFFKKLYPDYIVKRG